MMNTRVQLHAAAAAVLLVTTLAAAASIDTLSGWSGSVTDGFGELNGYPFTGTFGQTFRIQEGNARLRNVSFITIGKAPYGAPEVCTFQVGVAAWDGSRTTGTPLYMSDPMTTASGFFPTQTWSVPLGQTEINAGSDYVIFWTSNNYLNGVWSDAMLGITGDGSYSAGTMLMQNGTESISDLGTGSWYGAGFDVAMQLDYEVIPEPATLLLLGLGGIAIRRLR